MYTGGGYTNLCAENMKSETKKTNFKKIVNRLILFISLGVAAHILFLLYTTDQEILLQLGDIKFRYLIIIALLVLVPWAGHALRMNIWARFLKVKLNYRDALKIAVSTDLGAALTPTIIGGGPIKLGMLLNQGISASKAGIMIALGTLDDVVFYLTGIGFAFFFARESILKIFITLKDIIINNWIISLVVVLLLALYILLRRSGIIQWRLSFLNILPVRIKRSAMRFMVATRNGIQETKETVKFIIKEGKITFLISVTILYIQWFAKFSILTILLLALNVNIEFVNIYLKQWLVWMTMMFIPTPGATGGAEASFFLLFGSSIPKEFLTLIVSTWRFFTYYFIMLSAVVIYQVATYLQYRKQKKLAL